MEIIQRPIHLTQNKFNMKTKIYSFVTAAALLLGFSACHDPHEFSPQIYDECFDSMTAKFIDDDRAENSFAAEFDYVNHVITVVIPYTYPAGSDSYLEPADITNMKMSCNLKQGTRIEPALTTLDLSIDNHVTIYDNAGTATPYIIRGEIRKSTECEILDFTIPAVGVSGVINTNTKVVTLVSAEEIGEQLAEVEVSHGATLDPDPTVTPVNFDNEFQITVTAQNGVDKCVYTVLKADPTKLPFGLRDGSAKIAWAKKQADLGVTIYSAGELTAGDRRFNGSAGLGIVGEYLVLNEAGMGKAYVLNYKNGNYVRTLDLTAMGTNSLGQYNNHKMTSDDNGNLLFTSAATFNGGTLTIWKMKGLDGQLEKLTTLTNNTAAIGSSISVTGNIDGDAIITTNNNGPTQFYRWEVKNGVIGAAETIKPAGYAASCWGNFDAVYLEPTLPSDYITIGYVAFTTLPPNASGAENRTCAWHDGTTNEIKSFGNKCITSNSVENSGDIVTFNNVRYYIHNVMNTLGYGYGASMFMYNLATNDLSTEAIDFSAEGVNLKGNYGATAASNLNDRAGNGGDVCFFVSPDGFYLYIFFEFCNGYVGAVRADCIDM